MKSLWIFYDIPWKITRFLLGTTVWPWLCHDCAQPLRWTDSKRALDATSRWAWTPPGAEPGFGRKCAKHWSTCESMKKIEQVWSKFLSVCGNVDFRKMMMINQRIWVSEKPRLRARHHQGPNPPPELPERVHASIHICMFDWIVFSSSLYLSIV